MSKVNHSLSMKLSLGILLIVAPVFILALGALFLQSRYFIRQEASEHANSLLNTAVQRVRKCMSAVETSINANAWLIEDDFRLETLPASSHRIVQFNPIVRYSSISVQPNMFPQNGRYFSVCSLNKGDTVVTVRETNKEYLDRACYRIPIETGKTCWVEPSYEQAECEFSLNEAVASYCRPIRLKNGKIAGVVSASLSFRQLAEAMNVGDSTYPDAYFALLGSDGRYLIHPDSTRLFKKTIYTDVDPGSQSEMIALGHEMTAGNQGNMRMKINGKLCHVCYSPVPDTNWSLALICPDTVILSNYYLLTYIIIVLIVIGLLVILWLCNRSVRYAIRPLSRLLRLSQKIADGEYSEVIPYSKRKDVIGRLQNNFAIMQQSLYHHVNGICQTTKETEKRNDELVHAMKSTEEAVSQKDRFIQNISHQIRTPMNIILGFADVLRDGLASRNTNMIQAEDQQQIIRMMKYNAMHLNRMILMLYDSSESGTSRELMISRNDQMSCNELARECINYTYTHFPVQAIEYKTELPDAVCILTNHLYLMRSLRELLYNSAKFSDGKHIKLSVSQTETTVRFVVEDVGPGLSEESRDQLFKSFTKMDDLSDGLGLGLPLTKRHAINLGGNLVLDTSYNEGCRFVLVVPK